MFVKYRSLDQTIEILSFDPTVAQEDKVKKKRDDARALFRNLLMASKQKVELTHYIICSSPPSQTEFENINNGFGSKYSINYANNTKMKFINCISIEALELLKALMHFNPAKYIF